MFRTIIADPNPDLFAKTGFCQKDGLFFVQQTFEELDGTDLLQGRACVANAGNALGVMGAGVAGAIQKRFGTHPKWNARRVLGSKQWNAGESFIIKLGPMAEDSDYKFCAYTITMVSPGSRLDARENIPRRCMLATLNAVSKHNHDHPYREINTLVVPGFGTGIGGLTPSVVGEEMVEAYQLFRAAN